MADKAILKGHILQYIHIKNGLKLVYCVVRLFVFDVVKFINIAHSIYECLKERRFTWLFFIQNTPV